MKCLVNSSNHLTIDEIRTGLRYIFPQDNCKELRVTLGKMIQNFSKEYNLSQEMRHPLILIVDEVHDYNKIKKQFFFLHKFYITET